VDLDLIVEDLVVSAKKSHVAHEHDPNCAEGCSRGDEKHDDDLIFYYIDGIHADKKLSGYHSW
jgi:hypothetical protein